MIYCVRDADVLGHLLQLGFRQIGETPEGRAFVRDGARLSIRAPNVSGDIPEVFVIDAFDAAGLVPPKLSVFWCDYP